MTVFGQNVLNPEGVHTSTGPVRLWDCETEWARLEPEPGKFDWHRLDALVDAAGTRPVCLVLGHPPLWAAGQGRDKPQAAWMPEGSNKPPARDSDWARYVVSVAQRYKGKIDHYQVWNEPADSRFYTGTYTDLAALCTRTRSLIKRTDPKARLVSPPLQPRRQAGWSTRGQLLVRSLKAEKWPVDIISMHIYPQIGEGADAWKRDATLVARAVADARKPLWVTETNFNLVGPGNPLPLSTQNVLKASVRLISNGLGIKRVYWYGHGHTQQSLFGVTV